ncbi:MAG: caspase family protein [Saprospiraceae bacterium]|nr:caspase family protein [Saprospiraceae bacterium]
MKNLFALLVGINDYQKPLEKLRGCIKDINQIQDYIDKHCRDFNVQIKRLEDSSATYANIIDGFRTHLRKAGPEDVVWFHFSGHGSEEYCAEELRVIEPNGKDQTLICYDSRRDGAEHLADKELAVLLHEVANLDVDGNRKEGAPHIVVSLDCCHSGSGTRSASDDAEVRTRNAVSSGKIRSLDSYLDGYYARQGGTFQVPTSPHVVLSACESIQLAGDLSRGGAFTTGLVEALNKTGGKINYSDLFMQARSSVRKIRKNQTPQFDTIENFDPYVRFLSGDPEGSPDRYEVIRDNNKWYVKCGAIHGLPTAPPSPVELDIYDADNPEKSIGTATILSVGALRSVIDMESSIDIRNFFGSLIAQDKEYRAIVRHLPAPPEFVLLTGDADGIATLKDRWDDSKNVRWTTGDEDEATIEVSASDGQFIVTDLLSGARVFSTSEQTRDHADVVVDALGKMVKWRRFIRLQNDNPQSRMGDIAEFEVQVLDTQGGRTPYRASEIKLYASPENSARVFPSGPQGPEEWHFGFNPVVRVRNVTQPLYFYLFYLNADYAIECTDGEIVYRPEEYNDISELEIPLWKLTRGFGPGANEAETTSYFKCLVTTEQLDHQQFQQSGLGTHRSDLSLWNPGKISDDWAAFTMRVTIAREENQVAADRETLVAGGAVRIRPHAGVRAKVSVGHSEAGTRSQDPSHQFALLDKQGFEQIGFGATRSARTHNVLELNELRVDDPERLEDHPLDVVLPGSDEDGMILPVAFDGQHFRVIGDSESEGDETIVHIRELPKVAATGSNGQVDSPFAAEMQDRSLFRALKMSFFRLKIGKENVNQLQYVIYSDADNIQLAADGIKEKVADASNILVLLHGLAGNGRTMLQEIIQSAGVDWPNAYDLVLAYEYESLNTPLEKTANLLGESLEEVGIQDGDDKTVTLLGNSIGGLVARWYVERGGGSKVVDHCILVGAPHAGSLFGKLEEYRKSAMRWLDLGINFIPNLVPFSGFLLKGLRTAGDLGATLGQLNPESDFIKQLRKSDDPHVRYSIVSGDASGFEPGGKGLPGLIAKVRTGIGKVVNRGEAHDLFASVRSTSNEEGWVNRDPQPQVMPTLQCTHFSYLAQSDRFVPVSAEQRG